jgi:hypothetical protein
LIDIAPTKIFPLGEQKSREDYIAKRIDYFLLSEKLLESPLNFRQWIGCGGESDHHPIFMEIAGRSHKPTSPFQIQLCLAKG